MRKTTNRSLQLIVILVVSILFLVACTQEQNNEQNTNNENDNNQQNNQNNDPIKIGLFAPLTGEAASFGDNAVAGLTLAVNEINEKGGINGRMIEFVAEDDECSAKGVNAIQKLVNVDNVKVILGPICSASAGPAVPIAQENEVPVVMITASAPDLTSVGDNIFRVYPSDSMQASEIAEFITNDLQKTKAAVVYVKNDWGQGLNNVFKENFESLGGEVVYQGGIIQTETDFRTEVAKVKDSGADVLFLPLYPAGGVSAAKQIKEAGLDIPILGGDAFDAEEFYGSGVADGIMYSKLKVNTPEDFANKVKALDGNSDLDINMAAPLTYDAAQIIFKALMEVGDDSAKIREFLETVEHEGVSNDLIKFNDIGDLESANFEIKVVENSESVDYTN